MEKQKLTINKNLAISRMRRSIQNSRKKIKEEQKNIYFFKDIIQWLNEKPKP